jgi:hypothetical protein
MSASLAAVRVNKSRGDDEVWGDMDDEGVIVGAVGLTDEMTIGGRFDNVPKRLA